MIKNGKAEFYLKAQYLSILITPQYINILFFPTKRRLHFSGTQAKSRESEINIYTT